MRRFYIEDILDVLKDSIKLEEKDNISENTDLRDFGLDSIAFIRLIVSLEEKYNCEIPYSKLLISEMNTINKIIGVLSTLNEESYGK